MASGVRTTHILLPILTALAACTSADGPSDDELAETGTSETAGDPVGPGDPEWAHAHCDQLLAYPVAAQNADPGQIEVIVVNANDPDDPDDDTRDLRMPPGVVEWLTEQGWAQQHDDWHRIRRWDQGCGRSNATIEGPDGLLDTEDDCASAKQLDGLGLWRAPKQENAPGDGFAFLVMHRHMLQGIRQAFPDHLELFDGWTTVPRSQDDPENPMPWRPVNWSASQLEAIDKLEHIEDHLDEFPSEDDLARYMQAPFVWTESNPSQFQADSSAGIHFMMHAQWSVPGSPVNLGVGQPLVENVVFWQLHAWLDEVWERYRVAKGIAPDDPALIAELEAQCWEMHELGEAVNGGH